MEGLHQRFPIIRVFTEWIGGYQQRLNFPSTIIYYETANLLPVTGNWLETLTLQPNFRPENQIKLLKLQYHDHCNDPTIVSSQDYVKRQLHRINKTADQAMHDYVQVVYQELFKGLREQYENFDRLRLEIVITVPPERSTLDHARYREAFCQGPVSSEQIFIESEPAAMFRSWAHERIDDRDWVVGKNYLVADCGGGTCVSFSIPRSHLVATIISNLELFTRLLNDSAL